MAKSSGSKNKIIIAIVVIVILLIGAFLFLNKGKLSTNPLSSNNTAFTSIQDALSKSISLECEFTDESGRVTKSYIKNGAVRADITSNNANESGSTIIKDKKMYFWNSQGGYVMDIPDVTTTITPAANSNGNNSQSNGSDILKAMEEFKDHCKPAAVSDSLFTPPSDVTFTDMSKMMPSSVPQNGTAPQMNQEEIQKYMQQYQNSAPAQ